MNKKINGEGTIYFDSNRKRYIAQCTLGRDINGKLIRKSLYGKTASEVIEKLTNIQAKYNLGIYTDAKKLTFIKWIIKWFETYKIHDYKQNTYQKEMLRTKRIRESFLGNMVLDKIKPCDIQQFINQLSEEISAKTIKNIYMIMNGALKQAVAERLILINPCSNISLPKVIKPDVVALNSYEKEIFLKCAEDNAYYDFFVFALNTGMRESEICGLTRDCVDLQKGLITINKQLIRLKGEMILDTPKTKKSIRQIPITPLAREILVKYMYGSFCHKNFVFYNPKTKGLLLQQALMANSRKILNKCYEKTKIDTFLKASFHSFRHTFATNWILQNGNVALLSKVLGHTDVAFTMKVYVQPSTEDIKSEMLSMSF